MTNESVVLKHHAKSWRVSPRLIDSIGEEAVLAPLRQMMPACAELVFKQAWAHEKWTDAEGQTHYERYPASAMPGQEPTYVEFFFSWWQDDAGTTFRPVTQDDEPEFDDPDIDELRCVDCDGHHPTASCPYTDKD